MIENIFEVGDTVICIDNCLMENIITEGKEYIVDSFLDDEHISINELSGSFIHADRFVKKERM